MESECLFCRIVAGDVAAATVFEDELSLAFLDHRPLFPGHCLLIPKTHYETLPIYPRI
jgi:histidine triad (HIT) family protein